MMETTIFLQIVNIQYTDIIIMFKMNGQSEDYSSVPMIVFHRLTVVLPNSSKKNKHYYVS